MADRRLPRRSYAPLARSALIRTPGVHVTQEEERQWPATHSGETLLQMMNDPSVGRRHNQVYPSGYATYPPAALYTNTPSTSTATATTATTTTTCATYTPTTSTTYTYTPTTTAGQSSSYYSGNNDQNGYHQGGNN
ncbi:hypothetical protein SBOR_6650 [Sclerotinia borealis F-4128]|uniref:Uncharacterized protein n=1 Tax=Sclerotinia borealis (strain F-4128) TaxID=1432307 RepID=W9CDV5_SCLBF|nr:hypothetical protein SBOR_6650 [Sclerotinia borealis F-4128]